MTSLLTLAWIYFRIGLIFVGGGYVLIPLLNHIMVDQYHWLTLREFLDGLALSQLTPGPLAMLATFTGFRAGGFPGALIATVFIFLPCVTLMLVVGRNYDRLKNIDIISSTLDGLLPAVVGLVAAAAWNLGASSLSGTKEFIVLLIGFAIFKWTSVSPMVVIIGAGLVGLLIN
ncbi:MAG: chromate transporter [Geobacteraceae bacterium GWC2_55_20]|nr:MAG: chromate transporter [Geobacteraceae bacterium GWC2_55_20]OGU21318.1 MAG: chromate transporter [Geobacteraceae bacterium GWF2_54_21]HBA72663.1 chromate transporter [Geobacter sp.]HCE69464.1 chromate transporter [Geobacter sp.]